MGKTAKSTKAKTYFSAVVLPSEYSFSGHRRGYKVYIVKTVWDGKRNHSTFLPKSCVIGEQSFIGCTKLHEENITNGIIDDKSIIFVPGIDNSSFDKYFEVDNRDFIDIYKTFEKINKIESGIKYKVIEELYAQEFQDEKCSEERNEWLDEHGADEGYWVDYVEEDIQEYVDKLNRSMTSINKLQKELQKKQIKEYKLVEV